MDGKIAEEAIPNDFVKVGWRNIARTLLAMASLATGVSCALWLSLLAFRLSIELSVTHFAGNLVRAPSLCYMIGAVAVTITVFFVLQVVSVLVYLAASWVLILEVRVTNEGKSESNNRIR